MQPDIYMDQSSLINHSQVYIIAYIRTLFIIGDSSSKAVDNLSYIFYFQNQ